MNIGGHKIPKWAVWGGAIGGGLVLFIYFKNRSAGSSSSSQSGIDPATGLPYSQDNQIAGESAYGAAGGGGGYGYVGSAGFPTSNVANPSGTGSYATNAAWSQAVTAGLSSLGYSSTDIAAALGLYFADAPLTTVQASIVQAAIAEFGPPPQGTYSIVSSPSSGGAVGGSTGGTTTPVGGSTGSSSGSTGSSSGSTSGSGSSAPATSTVWGGHVVSVNNNDAVIAWGHSGPATSWRVTRTGPGGTQTNTVYIPQATYSGLAAGHNYQVEVQPLPTGQPGEIHFQTT